MRADLTILVLIGVAKSDAGRLNLKSNRFRRTVNPDG